MTPNRPLYIAETDEAGRINCVWYTASERPAPRPVRNPNRHIARLNEADCAGASMQAIKDWMAQNATPEAQ